MVYNIGEVEVKGMEAELSADLWECLTIWGNFTWQDGDKSKDPWDADNVLSNELPDFPDTMVNLGIKYHSDLLRAKLSMNHVSERDHYDGTEKVELGAYTLLNLFVNYQFFENEWGKWEIQLAVNNILDEDYEEEDGFPMPGITALGGIKVLF